MPDSPQESQETPRRTNYFSELASDRCADPAAADVSAKSSLPLACQRCRTMHLKCDFESESSETCKRCQRSRQQRCMTVPVSGRSKRISAPARVLTGTMAMDNSAVPPRPLFVGHIPATPEWQEDNPNVAHGFDQSAVGSPPPSRFGDLAYIRRVEDERDFDPRQQRSPFPPLDLPQLRALRDGAGTAGPWTASSQDLESGAVPSGGQSASKLPNALQPPLFTNLAVQPPSLFYGRIMRTEIETARGKGDINQRSFEDSVELPSLKYLDINKGTSEKS